LAFGVHPFAFSALKLARDFSPASDIFLPMGPDLQQGSAQESGEILVFLIRKETKCSECGQELWRGRMITLNRDYDKLLLEGIERHEARALVSRAVEQKLAQWSQAHPK
jgi:hypothetical protein